MNPAQLLVHGFAPGAEFEGRLVGAIERIESGGRVAVIAACRRSARAQSRPI